ncbi:MAG: hypothetical protein QOJ57_1314 [Thermoleophilaceae bacterium]|jgi:hypothetical protein|nr:hypothetical protein [Thermoleophilaceae bacterium]
MSTMESATVVSLDLRRERGRRVARAIDMRRGLETSDRRRSSRRGGRAWLNGQELGGRREALAHLGITHD